jgi:1-deoxy-D-xylulose 5-phosphate reductoisomerase
VESFLAGQLLFTNIPYVIEEVLAAANIVEADSLDDVLNADGAARVSARERIRLLQLQSKAAE